MGNKHASKTKYSRRRIGKVNTPLNKKLENVEWGEKIYLKELFSIKRGKRLTVEYRVKGERPLVTAGFEKTGVADYIGNENQETFPEDTITIDMFVSTFYLLISLFISSNNNKFDGFILYSLFPKYNLTVLYRL